MVAADAAAHDAAKTQTASSYGWFVVIALSVVNLVACMDRFMMGIVMVPLRTEMTLSDTELGMIYGLGFAILYSAAGIPMGRFADSHNRRNMIAAGCVLWSIGTLACAFATDFTGLMIARSAIGLGEAALVPAAISLIGAYIPRQGLGLANGVFFAGATAGKAISFIGGGIILSVLATTGGLTLAGHTFAPWQALFLLATIPGLGALFFVFMIREPKRATATHKVPPMAELFAYVRANARTYALVVFGVICLQLSALILAAWMPSFYVRRFEMDVAQAGVIVGLTSAFVGLIAALAGGVLTDKIARRGLAGAPLVVIAGAMLVSIPAAAIALVFTDTPISSAVAYALLHGCILLGGPQCFAAIQHITPLAHRGLTGALFLALVMLVALGIGPMLIGMLSDHVFTGDANALGLSLLTVICACGVLGAICMGAARQDFERTAIDAEAKNVEP